MNNILILTDFVSGSFCQHFDLIFHILGRIRTIRICKTPLGSSYMGFLFC